MDIMPTFRIVSIKMKLALTSLLIGSAAAFAPSKTASVSSFMVKGIGALLGYPVPVLGVVELVEVLILSFF
jgi:hypothetical protein